ncbi:MAG: ABC transporter permease [Bacteroidota bacterium]
MFEFIRKLYLYGLFLLFIAPFVLLGLLSLSKSWNFPLIFPEQLDLGNWQQLWNRRQGMGPSLLRSLGLSLSVAMVATALGFALSKAIAYHRYRHQFLLLAYFPYLISPVIYALMLHYYFVYFGFSGHLAGVFLAQMIIVFPFALIFFLGYWNEESRSLEQLVSTLGGNVWQTYLKVLIPMARGMLAVCFFQCFLISWFEFGLTNYIGVGKVKTLTILVYQYIGEANPYYAALSAYLLMLPPLILLWLNRRFGYRPYQSGEG